MIIDKRVYLPIKGIYSKFILADINSTNVPYPVKNPMTEPRYIDAILIKIVVNVIRKLHENHKKKPYTVRPLPEVLSYSNCREPAKSQQIKLNISC
ncbi:hypothetical protein M972_113091 [Acetivibrio thermocellus AD2]|uniref:Uncharacterized protein n=1 Tax=Acetivibrio thermocellus AD2 TaxID=1138384 RepID=A0AB36TK19_ACETH|nr:hypothetical protein AD2_02999 [Acetivibrio thermocellus AD2]ANV77751.1 hypothetical protein LQRI_3010 [Acetivibrio thermocellus DSM 2360]EIC03826.1 hypothetical protein YSBL_2467 [Acetivibrio thermocellus YS]THJ77517.1 hypothetical protein EPD62_11000 [Acetivibrio thermocellus]CDG36807.1 hypothetical protein CTHBC1_2207 [Acetivibrio thermocellus BC1]